ncbi:hypothetical protein SFRURICE_008831, partial [Spodoptera frugiperda]
MVYSHDQIDIRSIKVRCPKTSYASHATDFSLFCIGTHTTASIDPHRMDRIIGNAYVRCVLMTSYGMRTMRAMRTMRTCGRLPSLSMAWDDVVKVLNGMLLSTRDVLFYVSV